MLSALAIMVPSAAAFAASAGDLLSACISDPGTRGDITCNSYINGFVNGILIDQVAREGGKPICVDKTNTDAVRAAITAFFKNNPNILHFDGGSAMGAAFQRLYPCPKSN